MSDTDTQVADTQDPVEDTPAEQTNNTTSELETNAPEAAQDNAPAQEAGEPETKAEDTAEETLFAGKYKTVEELEKAYKNAESKIGQTTSEKARLSQDLTESFEAPTGVDTVDATVDPKYVKMERDMAVMKFITAHGDANPESMKDILTTDPMINHIQGHEAKLEYAYLKSQNMSQSQALEEARTKGAQETQAKIAEKESAKVESAQKAEPVDEGAELMNRATQGSPDEREAARQALIRKHLTNL